LAGAAIATVVYVARREMRFFAVADLLAPSLAIGHAVGRIGCFLAGCCFGRPSALPWAMRFPSDSLAWQDMVARGTLSMTADATPPLHPTQLYEALVELSLFVLLTQLAKRKHFDGQLLCIWLMGYSVSRSLIEMVRGDPARGLIGSISVAQIVSAVVFAIACALFIDGRRRARSADRNRAPI